MTKRQGATGAACNAPTRAIRVIISSPSDIFHLLSTHPAAWKLSITASNASRWPVGNVFGTRWPGLIFLE
ncbi:hypothetical protein [Photorhabdus tasmaniensis]|uniref:hypothetical protein n=1 Tax=Photorhabdus tasmaniensis TaxID=1004159 RepID=UPI00105F0540|nr:hypothetical protein [Photorhabdus tasmaniensis]